MENYNWKELAFADAVATSSLLDNSEITSHKVLYPGASDIINQKLVDCLSEKYEDSLADFIFAPVDYLPQRHTNLGAFTNLGVFARKDIEVGTCIPLVGLLATLPKCDDDLPKDTEVSTFKIKSEDEMMLGPLAFVNHSCWANTKYCLSQGWHISLLCLKIGKKTYFRIYTALTPLFPSGRSHRTHFSECRRILNALKNFLVTSSWQV